MKLRQLAATVVLPLTLLSAGAGAGGPATNAQTLERGRYLVQIGGCNDCHTAGYPERAGQVPEIEWLKGSAVGFQGPWGTTYPANLRLALNSMSEEQWLQRARIAMRPPMPWFNLRAMSDADLRALYRYVRSLGPAGTPAPAFVAAGQEVATPYIVFAPQNLPPQAAAR
jgi:mono/diheme cytochrome c family protein